MCTDVASKFAEAAAELTAQRTQDLALLDAAITEIAEAVSLWDDAYDCGDDVMTENHQTLAEALDELQNIRSDFTKHLTWTLSPARKEWIGHMRRLAK